jgi:hypothetical protein
MINLTPRLRAARLSISRLTIDLNIMRMQRNVYRDHAKRLADAIDAINTANAYAPSLRGQRLNETIGKAVALAGMVRDYDDLQSITDTTIQEN